MNIPLVDLRAQYKEIKKDVDGKILGILSKGNFILGDEVYKFEKEFAKYNKVKYCVGLASGYDAVTLSLRALGIGQGDEVITVANTFIATILPIISLGAKPILVDIDPNTYLIDSSKIEKAITKKTKAIIPVHLFGRPCNMDVILKIAKKYNLYVIEDAAQAHGSTFKNKRCGTFGDVGAFSFYPGKNLGAAGDAGAIITNNSSIYQKVKIMRDVGQSEKYLHTEFGYNSRLDTVQAAFLSAKLKKLNEWNNKRISIANLYNNLLADLDLKTPGIMGKPYKENFHLYVIRIKKRDELKKFLEERGVHSGIHYPIPVHLQKVLKFLGYKKGDFPITEKYAKEILSLPIYPHLKKSEAKKIAGIIRKFFKK